MKSGAARRPRLGPQPAAVRFDQRPADRQAEARPRQGREALLDGALGGFERVELLRACDQAGILVDALRRKGLA